MQIELVEVDTANRRLHGRERRRSSDLAK
jgi:hypothetical protein